MQEHILAIVIVQLNKSITHIKHTHTITPSPPIRSR